MREIQLRYFASVRESIGLSGETVQTSAGTVAELRQALVARGEPYQTALASQKRVRAAVNQMMVDAKAELPRVPCEVAFFPPVTGG
jgi:sulfur-carrier protein